MGPLALHSAGQEAEEHKLDASLTPARVLARLHLWSASDINEKPRLPPKGVRRVNFPTENYDFHFYLSEKELSDRNPSFLFLRKLKKLDYQKAYVIILQL